MYHMLGVVFAFTIIVGLETIGPDSGREIIDSGTLVIAHDAPTDRNECHEDGFGGYHCH